MSEIYRGMTSEQLNDAYNLPVSVKNFSAFMTLSVRLLMRIYQGASLSWHWSAGVLATAVSGSYCAVKGFILTTNACTVFII